MSIRHLCSFTSCSRYAVARGLCDMHYRQARKGWDFLPELKSHKDRLLEKITQRGTDECWPWKGSLGTWGYGSFTMEGKNYNSSRATYLLLIGSIPDGQCVCHTCDHPACCNPAHLWLGSQQDNLEDCRQKGRARSQLSMNGYAGHPRYNAKLTPERIDEARKLYSQGISQSELGRRWGIHSSAISRAINRKTFRHL